MIYVLFGALAGLAACGMIYALVPGKMQSAEILQALDAELAHIGPTRPAPIGWRAELGSHLARALAARGIQMPSLRKDLALLRRDLESLLAVKILLAAFGVILVPALWAFAAALGLRISGVLPLWGSLLTGAALFFLPDQEVRSQAKKARADFRRVISAYLDLISMNLEGGRGVPEALSAAAGVGHGPAFDRLTETVTGARLSGTSPWTALGRLGTEIGVDELVDLSIMLENVADQGAKVRQTLTERAKTMRARHGAEIEEAAGGRTQSMLLAQMLFATGLLAYLLFPALMKLVTI